MTFNIETIKEQVKEVLEFSGGDTYNVDILMERWSQSKAPLIEAFGGKLIIELDKEIAVGKPDEDKILAYHDYCSDVQFIVGSDAAHFLEEQGWTSFYENQVREDWKCENGTKIPKGMKISRALKFFTEGIILDKLQIRYSKLLQEEKVTGKLCLSIHPLDYLSMSETTHSWRSCHALDGEYRGGNLSYIGDTTTIVAYLKSEGDFQLPGFPTSVPWNSKKWRMLLFVNGQRDLIVASKPYPFDNSVLVKETYDAIEALFPGEWPDTYTTTSRFDIEAALEDHEEAIHFNDCLLSPTYLPRFKSLKGTNKEVLSESEIIIVGAPVMCLKCGKRCVEFGGDYVCIECGDYITCDCCGTYMYTKEAYDLDGQVLCPGCYDDQVVWCNGCGNAHSRENPEIVYNETLDTWYDSMCYQLKLQRRKARKEV